MAKAKDIFPADDDEAVLEYIERQLYKRDDPGVPDLDQGETTPDVEDQVEGGAHVTATAATTIDRAEAMRFLNALEGSATRFTFQTFDDNADRKDPDLARIIHGTLTEVFDELVRLSARGAGIFVTINETDFLGREAKNIVRVRCLFVDFDGAPLPTEWAKKPHLIIESSPGRWHAYWQVDGVALDEFRAKQKALIARYGSDKGVHDLNRVLRLPGFPHQKVSAKKQLTGEPRLVRIVEVSDLAPYSAGDFESAAEEPHQPSSGDPTADPARISAALAVIPNDHEPLKGYAIPSKGEPRRNDDWDVWNSMGMAIFRATAPANDVGLALFLAWSRKNPRYQDDDAGTEERWKQIKKSPPDEITAASIIYRANLENPRWPVLIGNSIEVAIEVNALSLLPATQYDQQRKDAAKRLGWRVGTLDDLVERLRSGSGGDDQVDKQGQEITFKPPEPWPAPVDGAALVEEMCAVHHRYVVMSKEYALAITLWEIHTHAIDAAEHTPRLQIRSAAYRCGKTTLLRVISAIVPKPVSTESITMSALFRLIELAQPSILLDEAETTLKRGDGKTDNEEMRGILNSGHRRGGGVIRTVGDDFEPRMFTVFAPLCFCWLVRRGEQVAQTIADRSITVELRRKLRGEEVTRLRSNRTGNLSTLGRRAARWVADNMSALSDADPVLPDELNDRAQDNWRPLIAIADAMSEGLGQRAREAAKVISAEAAIADEDAALLALADVDDFFKEKQEEAANAGKVVKALPSDDVVNTLVALSDRPWATWRKGSNGQREPITQHGLSRLLKPYGIKPKKIREGLGTYRGYEAKAIREARERFVDTETGFDQGDDVVDL